MTEEEINDFIITQIGKHRQRSDIAIDLCEMTGMEYRDAQKLVHQVAYEKRRAIAARQSPIVVIFGVGIILSGVILLFYNLIPPILAYSAGQVYIPRLSMIFSVGLALALIIGGVAGLWQTIREFLD